MNIGLTYWAILRAILFLARESGTSVDVDFHHGPPSYPILQQYCVFDPNK
jgi:hypothetical protein